MARVEVDEEQVRQDAALRDTVATMLKNPKARLLVEQAHKLVDPSARTPALDQRAAIEEPVKSLEQKFDDFVKQTAAEREKETNERKLAAMRSEQDAAFQKLKSSGRWTEAGIKKINEVMEEKGILDVSIAAAYVESVMPQQTPSTPSGIGGWNFLEMPADSTDENLKKLVETRGESDVLTDKMAREALAEIRGQSR